MHNILHDSNSHISKTRHCYDVVIIEWYECIINCDVMNVLLIIIIITLLS